MSASATTRTGTRPVQNFDHRNARVGSGEVRITQNAGPSAETSGKTKRTATADSTKAAMARFTNAYAFFTTPAYDGLPLVMLGLGAVSLVETVRGWRGSGAGVLARGHHVVVFAGLAALTWFTVQWNLLGWQF